MRPRPRPPARKAATSAPEPGREGRSSRFAHHRAPGAYSGAIGPPCVLGLGHPGIGFGGVTLGGEEAIQAVASTSATASNQRLTVAAVAADRRRRPDNQPRPDRDRSAFGSVRILLMSSGCRKTTGHEDSSRCRKRGRGGAARKEGSPDDLLKVALVTSPITGIGCRRSGVSVRGKGRGGGAEQPEALRPPQQVADR